MIQYRPRSLYERFLGRLQSRPDGIGFSARRKLRRAWAAQTIAAFDADVARLGPGDIVLDLGANVGRYTRQLAATGAEVHAYEPDPDSFARLTAAVGDLPNVTCHQAAIGAQAGIVRLYRAPQAERADFSEMASTVFAASRQYQAEAIDVEQRAFDAVLAAFDRPVRLIKMDIEGAEFEILRSIFAAPEGAAFDALYVETHETRAPDWIPEIDRMRTIAAGLARPRINLYWP